MDAERAGRRPTGVEAAAMVAGLAATLGAFLYYFGWARTTALSHQVGIPQDVLSFGTYDYMLRGVSSTVRPLGLIILLIFAIYTLHRALWTSPSHSEVARLERVALRSIETAALCLGLSLVLVFPYLGRPTSVGLALVLVGLLLRMVRRFSPATERSLAGPERVLLVTATIFVAIWTTTIYANYQGTLDARQLETELNSLGDGADVGALPTVALYSKSDLGIENITQIQVYEMTGPNSFFHYQYRGLYSLSNRNGRSILLYRGWRRGLPVVVLERSDELRLEYSGRP
jgi:hypothetical protein